MPNQTFQAISLDDAAGVALYYSRARVVGVAVKQALAGNLTVTGIVNLDSTPAAWTVSAGATAFSAAPGTQQFWGSLSFQYANPADAGRALLVFQPL